MYLIKGIIRSAKDTVTGQPRKQLFVRYPDKVIYRTIDIPFDTKENPGQLKRVASGVLSIKMSEINVSDYLKKLIKGD